MMGGKDRTDLRNREEIDLIVNGNCLGQWKRWEFIPLNRWVRSSLSTDESGHVTPQLRTLQWLPSHAEWKLKSSQWATRMKKSVQHILTLALLPQWIPPSCLPASSLYLTHSNILLFSNIPGMSSPYNFCFCSAQIPVWFIPVPSSSLFLISPFQWGFSSSSY